MTNTLNLKAIDGHVVPQPDVSSSPLTLRGVTVSYGQKPAVFSVDATFPAQSMSAIIGPNGAGKSTLLKSSLDIVPRLSGDVRMFGLPLNQARHKMAYVPQRASVDWDFPTTVIDVVLMGIYRKVGLLGWITGKHREIPRTCLDRVAMADFADRQIGQLSGGQQQRVFIARALAQDADLYLLDEPLSGVDAATERTIIDVLKSLKAERKAVIAVHHDLATVNEYFDHVFLINVRKVAEGSVARTFTSENLQATYGGRLATTHIEQLCLERGGAKLPQTA